MTSLAWLTVLTGLTILAGLLTVTSLAGLSVLAWLSGLAVLTRLSILLPRLSILTGLAGLTILSRLSIASLLSILTWLAVLATLSWLTVLTLAGLAITSLTGLAILTWLAITSLAGLSVAGLLSSVTRLTITTGSSGRSTGEHLEGVEELLLVDSSVIVLVNEGNGLHGLLLGDVGGSAHGCENLVEELGQLTDVERAGSVPVVLHEGLINVVLDLDVVDLHRYHN